MTTIAPNRGTVGAEEFAALCNLFCSTHCSDVDPTPQQAGDILYFGANRTVCDHSRLMARAVLAYLGIGVDVLGGQELINETKAAMLNGKGSLPDADDEAPE